MSAPVPSRRPVGRLPESERSDWTEQDLLTREEAHGRLVQEIDLVQTQLGDLGDGDKAERELLESRLRALRSAASDLLGSQ